MGKRFERMSNVRNPHLFQLYNACTWYNAWHVENAQLKFVERRKEEEKKERLWELPRKKPVDWKEMERNKEQVYFK